jgi:hypothetical protein
MDPQNWVKYQWSTGKGGADGGAQPSLPAATMLAPLQQGRLGADSSAFFIF